MIKPKSFGTFFMWAVGGGIALNSYLGEVKTFSVVKFMLILSTILTSLYFYYVSVETEDWCPSNLTKTNEVFTWGFKAIQYILFLSMWLVVGSKSGDLFFGLCPIIKLYPFIVVILHGTYLLWDYIYRDYIFKEHRFHANYLSIIDGLGLAFGLILILVFNNLPPEAMKNNDDGMRLSSSIILLILLILQALFGIGGNYYFSKFRHAEVNP